MTDPFANFSNTLAIGQKHLKWMLEPAQLIKVKPLNYWSMATFTDRDDKLIRDITAGKPKQLDCRGMKVWFE